MVAENIFIVADNGQFESTGGTSVAAPLWAGFAALANQRAASAGLSSIGFLNPALYHIGTNSGYAACFTTSPLATTPITARPSIWLCRAMIFAPVGAVLPAAV